MVTDDRSRRRTVVRAERLLGAQIGDGNVQYNYFDQRAVTLPHRVGIVPPLADGYLTRDQLTAMTDQPGTHILTGMGGVGKTQYAAGHAEDAWRARTVDLLVWVNASNRASVLDTFALAATDLTGIADADPHDGAGRFLNWLASTDRRWLIVLDDLQLPADLAGLWPPAGTTGRVLVTTRWRDAALAGAGRHVVDVGLFRPEESLAFLSRKLGPRQDLLDGAEALAEDLGQLPLALGQAATWILNRAGLTCDDYRRRLADRRRSLGSLLPDDAALPDSYRGTVAAAWSLSVAAADKLQPAGLARPALEMAAVLDPNGVPLSLFTDPAALRYLNRSGPMPDPDDATDALHNLHRMNLATVDRRAGVLRVHALVQRAAREGLAAGELAAATHAAADALTAIWPDPESDRTAGNLLRSNADALLEHGMDPLMSPDAHPVIFRAGRSIGEAGLFSDAAAHAERLVASCLRTLGPDHASTLRGRAYLAKWRGEAGDSTGTAAAYVELLADHVRVLGPDHEDTLKTRHSLARWTGKSGDAAAAAESLQRLLDDRVRLLGPLHLDTLATRNSLGVWRGKAGDPDSAVRAFQELLDDQIAALGPDHPSALITRNNIALWTGRSGDAAGAVRGFEALLADRLRILGPDHPRTLTTRGNLAKWRGEAGDAVGAIRAFQELFDDRERLLGPDHPHTLNARYHVAHWTGVAGDPARAVALLETLVADRERLLGPDHHETARAREELADWRRLATGPGG